MHFSARTGTFPDGQSKRIYMKRYILSILFCCVAAFASAAATVAAHNPLLRNINMSNGLSAYGVRHIAQDPNGFMWFGTDNGLCRYDGIRIQQFRIPQAGNEQFISALATRRDAVLVGTASGAYLLDLRTERFRPLVPRLHTTVTSIAIDCDSNLWVATDGAGVWQTDRHGRTLRHFPCKANRGKVNEVYVDRDNQIWISSAQGAPLLARYNKAEGQFRPVAESAPGVYTGGLHLLHTQSGDFYAGSWSRGLFRLLPDGRLEPVPSPGQAGWGTNTASLIETKGGEILLACDEGLQAYDPVRRQFRQVTDNSRYGNTGSRFAYAVVADEEGGIWYGTYYGGVTYISPIANRFESFAPAPDGLQGTVVEKFCEDASGRIWIATDDGGLNLYSPQLKRFLDFPARQALSRKNVHGLCLRGGDLWIGTYGDGIYRMSLATGSLRQYSGLPAYDDTNSYSFWLTPAGELWTASINKVQCYDEAADRFVVMHRFGALTVDMKGDRQGNIWFATQGDGLWRYDSHRRRWHHYLHADRRESLLSNFVNSLCLASDGRLLIATSAGVCAFDHRTGRIRPRLLEGQAVNCIIGNGRSLYLTTDHGLLLCAEGDSIRRFNRYDGLASEQSLPAAGFMASDGQVYLGGVGGFSVFSPYRIRFNRHAPRVFITQLQVNNRTVETGSEQLPEALACTRRIDLDHTAGSITLSFASLSYCAPEKNRYAYMLEGLDREWNYAGADPQATYNHLPAGTYTFRVKATNNDGTWSEQEARLEVVVHPPFWWSVPARVFYCLLVAFLIYLYTHLRLQRARRQHKREMNAERKRRRAQEKEQRLRFFTLVAHEIRTPVSLIIGPLETVIEQVKPSAENLNVRRNLSVIQRNAERLLELVNQLLDFDKVQHDCMRLTFGPHSIRRIVESVAERFSPTLQQRGIRLAVDCPEADFEAVVDEEAITKVVSNLMSNAMKYTRDSIRLALVRPDEGHFAIRVSDNGPGVSPEERDRIFAPFYQAHDNKPGTGIGLSTVKSIVERHRGTVEVTGGVGQGAVFTVVLPVGNPEAVHLQPAVQAPAQEVSGAVSGALQPDSAPDPAGAGETRSVLVVEDDADLRGFIAETLSAKYDVSVAENGREALRILRTQSPTLIVSDWMMPEMDGEALCRAIRADRSTSHIPFIMLTAKTDDASKVKGMDCGADAFIEKPFSVKYLEACIRRLIQVRRQLMDRFVSHPEVPIKTISKSEVDDALLDDIRTFIEGNLSNPQLSVDFVVDSLHMGRSSFYKKIKALADVTPNEFILAIRLRKAIELIRQGNSNMADLARTVGFSSAPYFKRCFQKQFNCTPKEYYEQYMAHPEQFDDEKANEGDVAR